jgi:hypothetical protein
MDAIDGRICLLRLQHLIDEIDELLTALRSEGLGARSGREHARGLLCDLKCHLADEHRRTISGAETLAEADAAYYVPAVCAAYLRLRASAASVPDGRWHSELSEARRDLAAAADQLQAELRSEPQD